MRLAEGIEIVCQNPELAKEIRDSMRKLEELIPRFIREIKVGTNREEYDS
jgi:hypothetical protein